MRSNYSAKPTATPLHQQKEKHMAKLQRQKALEWLAAKFPEALDNQTRIRPLKIGVMQDIMACAEAAARDGISKTKLREALVLFTRRIDYLTCLKAREIRIDLQGNAVEQVNEIEAEKAAAKIKKRVEKATRHAHQNITSKAAPHQPQRERATRESAARDSHRVGYPSRAPSTYHQADVAFPAKPAVAATASPSITMKRKFTKVSDAQMILKLKEKLDLVES